MSKFHFTLLGASAAAVMMLAAPAAGADGPRTILGDQYGRPLIWSGAYVGAHMGGSQFGYNVQAGRLVVGVEADVSFGSGRDSFTDAWTAASRVELGTQNTLTAHVGLPVGQFMPYIKGGLAWTRVNVYGDILQDGAPSGGGRDETKATKTLAGWTIGGGLEYALRGNWTVRAEYLFTDFRAFRTTNSEDVSFRHDLDTHSVRFGLNYKLGN